MKQKYDLYRMNLCLSKNRNHIVFALRVFLFCVLCRRVQEDTETVVVNNLTVKLCTVKLDSVMYSGDKILLYGEKVVI